MTTSIYLVTPQVDVEVKDGAKQGVTILQIAGNCSVPLSYDEAMDLAEAIRRHARRSLVSK